MTGRLTAWGGKTYDLPELLRWEVSYTGGVPGDSFSVTCLYEGEMLAVLPQAYRFSAFHEGKQVFFGVVDEYIIQRSDEGRLLTLTGRGLAALLLDNESEAVSYQSATLRDIYEKHAKPLGIRCGEIDGVSGSKYSVISGSSQWKALSRFCEYFGGFSPRFTPLGELLLTKKQTGATLVVDETTPLLDLRWRENRYGVISEVLVQDKSKGTALCVENRDLKNRGGSARRVVYMPSRSSYAAMRYTGEFQIRRSREEALQIELRLAGVFLAWPGDTVTLHLPDCGMEGSYIVAEAENRWDESGALCTLILSGREE